MSILKKYGTILLSDSRCKKLLQNLNLDKTSNSTIIPMVIPPFFDGRITWNSLINEVDYQSSCISCWAFATLFVLSSRLAIYTNGQYKLKFSAAKMIFQKNNLIWDDVKKDLSNGIAFDYSSPNKQSVVNTCSENSLIEAWQYLYSFGVPDDSCVNDKSKIDNVYTSNILFGDTYDKCPATNEDMIHHRISGYYYVTGTSSKSILFQEGHEVNIRRDIYHWGPCSTVMRVFQDFLDWDGNGIYRWDKTSSQSSISGHAIVLMGWGEENGTPYWIARNSWGKNWGNNGYFKIVRGINHCEIEENVFVGYPTLPAIKLFIEYPILYRFDDFILRGKWGIQDNGYKLTTLERNKNIKPKSFIYDPKSWADFSTFIAADLTTLSFKVKDNIDIKESFEITTNQQTVCFDTDTLNLIIFLLIISISFRLINHK